MIEGKFPIDRQNDPMQIQQYFEPNQSGRLAERNHNHPYNTGPAIGHLNDRISCNDLFC